MLANVVRISVEATILEGHFEEFRKVAQAMTAATEAEQGTIGYEWFFSADGRQCRLLETYVDSAAVLAHFTGPVVSEIVPQMASFCKVDRFEFYGDPGPEVFQIAAAFGAQQFHYWTGLSR
jgi:quinol monooxygenase YgiN